ncbi:hypothetical protein TELCIR_16802, partial [Teladorsagia circumcincta]
MSFNDCMYWDENVGVNVILFDRINKKRVERKVTSDAFFTFHHANSYEKDGFLVLDYAKMLSPGNFDDLLLEHMRTGGFRSKVVKVDLKDGTSKTWYKDAEDHLCAEPILVNKPGYSKEDEGVLIVPVVTCREGDTPYVVVLDAETMEEQARY